MTVATRPDPTVLHPHDIRPMYYGVQMVIFCVIRVGKSGFSVVSVWFFKILLSWCYHGIPLSSRKSTTRSLNSSKLDSKQL